MKQIFLLPVFFALFLASLAAFCADIVLFESGLLRQPDAFEPYECVFTPASDAAPAAVSLPRDKWSALIFKTPVDPDFSGDAVFRAEVGLKSDPAATKNAAFNMQFYDAGGKAIPVPLKERERFLPVKSGRQTCEIRCAVPKGTSTIRIDLTAGKGGVFELFDYSLVLAGNVAAPAEGIELFNRDSLKGGTVWKPHDARYTPMTAEKPAAVVFPVGTWSALIGRVSIDPDFTGSVEFDAAVNFTGDLKNAKGAALCLIFSDEDGNQLQTPLAERERHFQLRHGVQHFKIRCALPKGTRNIRIDFSSMGGSTLEISDVLLKLIGMNLTEAAVNGVKLPGIVPPPRAAAGAEKGRAEIEVFESVPYDFDAPFWQGRPAYEIPNTSLNKSALIPGDNKAEFRLASDGRYIYVRFRALDDVLNFSTDSIHTNDCFEFFLQPTGLFQNPRVGIRHEQFTVSRDSRGKTLSNTTARTRLVEGGWEAMMKIELQNEVRKLYPFNGLELQFNALYQDTDTVSQEHYLSLSPKDQENRSWNDSSVYVPLVFVSRQALPYRPFNLGDTAEYTVDANFPGRINLIDFPADPYHVGFWGTHMPEAVMTVSDGAYHFTYPDHLSESCRLLLPAFTVLAGETLLLEFDAKTDKEPFWGLGADFLANSNWVTFGFRCEGDATVTNDWKHFVYKGKAGENFRNNMRSGRILFAIGARVGRTVSLRNFKITRMLPVDFDMLIRIDHRYSHLIAGEKNEITAVLDSPDAKKAKLVCEVVDYFSGKSLLKKDLELSVPAGRSEVKFDVSELPNGFFNCIVRARTPEGKFLADRELYINKYEKAPAMNRFSGMWYGHFIGHTPPLQPELEAKELIGMGVGTVYFGELDFVSPSGTPLWRSCLEMIRPMKEAGFLVGSLLQRGDQSKIRSKFMQPIELTDYFRDTVRASEGLIDFWNFSNEPNLDGGWLPRADAREWIQFNRPFYNAVKEVDPKATVLLGNLNSIPVGYLRECHEQNGNAFADGVIGVHLYGVEVNGNGFENLLKARGEYEKLYPGWKVWDTESGSVFHTFRSLDELITKKAPILLCAGVEMAIFYDIGAAMIPHADATSVSAVEPFKNRFYPGLTPVGRVTLADGSVHAYLFRDGEGKGAAVLWNRLPSEVEFTLPGSAGAEHFDQYGNRRPAPDGDYVLKLTDRFVNYFRNVDLAALTGDASFIPAFRPSAVSPRREPGDVSEAVYVVPGNVTRNFDQYLVEGEPVELELYYSNEGGEPVTVTPSGSGAENLAVSFEPARLELAPGQAARCVAALKSGPGFEAAHYALGGTFGGGRKIVPTVFYLNPAPPVSVEGTGRAVIVRNNSGKPADVELIPKMMSSFFTPEVIRRKGIKPGETVIVPIALTRRDNNFTNRDVNGVELYDIRAVWNGGEFTANGRMTAFQPQPLAGEVDFSRLAKSFSADEFKVDYQLFEAPEAFRFVARIYDDTPVQTGELGTIRTGGDVFSVGISDKDGYREYGFSAVGGRSHSYRWNGRYGIETAVSADECVRVLRRTAEHIDLDVVIPRGNMVPGDGMSLRIVNRDGQGKERVVELGGGMIPFDANRMGVLIK